MIDTHAHIYDKAFKEDLADIIEASRKKGIQKIFMPNIDQGSIALMMAVEEQYPQMCYAMMGLHPSSVDNGFEKELYLVEEWLNKRKFIAVGEIGLDLYWDKTYKEQQKEAFKVQIELAKKYELPVVIHCREAFEETITMVEACYDKRLRGVFHCFSGSKEEADRITQLGFFLGIGGVVTFKNGGLDKVVPELSLENLLLETDSPYLAPVPHRGKRNEPLYLPIIAQKIADLKQVSVEAVAEFTTANAEALFKN